MGRTHDRWQSEDKLTAIGRCSERQSSLSAACIEGRPVAVRGEIWACGSFVQFALNFNRRCSIFRHRRRRSRAVPCTAGKLRLYKPLTWRFGRMRRRDRPHYYGTIDVSHDSATLAIFLIFRLFFSFLSLFLF